MHGVRTGGLNNISKLYIYGPGKRREGSKFVVIGPLKYTYMYISPIDPTFGLLVLRSEIYVLSMHNRFLGSIIDIGYAHLIILFSQAHQPTLS